MEHIWPVPAAITAYLAAYNRRDIPAMLEQLTEDVRFEHFNNGFQQVVTTDREQFRTLAEHSAELFREREQTVRSVIQSGDQYTLQVSFRGVLSVNFPNLGLPEGGTVRMDGESVYQLRDGRICHLIDRN